MANPPSLGRGKHIATISPWIGPDAKIRLASAGERFTDVTQAEARAKQIASSDQMDAVVIRDRDGSFGVYVTGELQRASGGKSLDDIRGDLKGVELPDGATIHSFLATRGSGARADVEHVVLGRRDPLEGFATDLVSAGLKEYEVRAMRDGISLDALRSLSTRLRARASQREVAQVLQRIDSAITANDRAAGTTRISFNTVATASNVAATAYSAPPAVIKQATDLMNAYRGRSQILADSIDAQRFAEFIDGWGFTGRIRPEDGQQAILRLNAAIFSVRRDLQSGAVGPSAFGVEKWSDVTPRHMTDLAERRLRDRSYAFRPVVPAMIEDAAFAQNPLQMVQDDVRKPITREPGFGMSRGIGNMIAPDAAALDLASLGVTRAVRDAAIADARYPNADDSIGDLRVALALWRGDGVPRDASQAILAVSGAAGVSIAGIDVARGTTKAALEAQKQSGAIAAYREADEPGVFYTYKLRTPMEFAKAVRQHMDNPRTQMSDGLRTMVETIIGKPGATGIELAGRLQDQESSAKWRAVGNEVVIAAAAGVVSFGVGAAVAGSVSAARVGYLGVRAASIVAQSVSFTATSQAIKGDFNGGDYARDALMMLPLAMAQRFGGMLGAIARGTGPTSVAARRILGNVGALGAATTASTGWGVLESHLAGQPLKLEQIREQFVANLAVAATLHGVNTGLARALPSLAPDVLAQRAVVEARAKADAARVQTERASAKLHEAVGELASATPGSEAAQMLTAAVEKSNADLGTSLTAERQAYNALGAVVRPYMPQLKLPPDLEAIAASIPELRDVLTFANLSKEHLADLQRLAGHVRRGASLAGVEPALLIDPTMGPPLIDYLAPTSRARAVPPKVLENQVQATRARTDDTGIAGLTEQPLNPRVARALRADAAALKERVDKLASTYSELITRARNGDLAAQQSLDAYAQARAMLDARRHNNSNTVNLGLLGYTSSGARPRANADRVEALTTGWLNTDSGPLTPELVRQRLSDINRVATEGLTLDNGAVGTQGRYREPGLEVYTGAGTYIPGAEVNVAMTRFANWFVNAEGEVAAGRMTPVELAARSYQTLVSIHPFMDGNGRSTRAFLDWTLQRHGLPPATLIPGREVHVAHFLVRDESLADTGAPDQAAVSVSAGVHRSLGELERALYRTGPTAEQTIQRRGIHLQETP